MKRAEWDWCFEWRWGSVAVGLWVNHVPGMTIFTFQPFPFACIFATRYSGECVSEPEAAAPWKGTDA